MAATIWNGGRVLVLLLLWLAGASGQIVTAAPEFDQGPVLNLTEENDFFAGTDRWYTQGARISFLQADNDVPKWTDWLLDKIPTLGFSTGAERIGYFLGQSVYTPADTHASRVELDDRPYAGWLYAGLALQRRGLGLGDYLTLESFQVLFGVVGPESGAGQLQTWYHHHAPEGWPNQLNDEPGFALRYGRAWLIPLPHEPQHHFDLIPFGGLSAGNVDTSFRAGGTLRAGWNLPQDFGIQLADSLFLSEGGWSRTHPPCPWSVYAFTGIEGRAVLYTVFLDGNSFRESHHVDKEPFVGAWRSGLVVAYKRLEAAYTHIFLTEEFKKQPKGHSYGSITLRYKF